MLTAQQIEVQLTQRGAIANIGQIAPAETRLLNVAAKAGRLVKYRGYWNTLSPDFGMGPLKSCWATPAAAELLGLAVQS